MLLKSIDEFLNIIPNIGTILSIDMGTHNIGIARSDRNQEIADPCITHRRISKKHDIIFFQNLIETYSAIGIIMGWPIQGTHFCKFTENTAKKLSNLLPVLLYDEQFTTKQAEYALALTFKTGTKIQKRDDRVAATILLQEVLDYKSLHNVVNIV